ncbi:MAG: GNAT family N-acetyltransferase [Spirochaetales bacterium]|nr:GNAT family N-acetyltransferase [Spirochaetales bacterium]
MNNNIADNSSDWDAIVSVYRYLRPNIEPAELKRRIDEQIQEGFQVAYAEAGGVILAAAGFRIQSKLAWGRHLYIDDLVTVPEFRSKGAGGNLLRFLIEHAKEEGCGEVHLDSGVQREGAHKFYFREGFVISSYHFKYQID